jgi:hypothetical protein
MVCISTVYLFTVLTYSDLEFSDKENQDQSRYEGNVTSEVRFSEVLLLFHFPGDYLFNIIKITSISPIQILRLHSSCSRQNILSTSYRRNTKVQIEQIFYRGFRRIDSNKLIYRLIINTI